MLAVKAKQLIDGTSSQPLHEAVLLVDDTRVVAAGRLSDLGIPDGSEVVDAGQMTIIPGLIDAHTHVSSTGEPRIDGAIGRFGKTIPFQALQAAASGRKALDMGITAVRDVGAQGFVDVALRDAIDEGLVEGPRMRVAGHMLTATGGHGDPRRVPPYVHIEGRSGVANGPDQVRAAARYQLKMGADLIKLASDGLQSDLAAAEPRYRQEMTFDEMLAACEVAHWEGKFVASHCAGGQGTLDAIRAGVNTLEHGHWLTEEHVDLMIKMGTFWVPTFTAPYNTLILGREAANVPDHTWEWKTAAWEGAQRSFELARAAGIPIAVGTDAGYRYCRHGETAKELLIMRELGMTPMDAILATTAVNARALNWDGEIGTLTAGKRADFVLVDGDPLRDLSILLDVRRIAKVFKGGRAVIDRCV